MISWAVIFSEQDASFADFLESDQHIRKSKNDMIVLLFVEHTRF